MFPTTTNKTTGREEINRNFYDLDSLLSDLNQPKEEITNTQPGSIQNQGSNIQNPDPSIQNPESDPISPEVAALSGKMIAGTIDTVAGTGLSLYAKNNNAEKYQATPRQLVQLEQACTAVALKYNYKVEDSPWFNLVILFVAIYLPNWQEAKKDKRFAEIQERINEEALKREALEKRVETIENKK